MLSMSLQSPLEAEKLENRNLTHQQKVPREVIALSLKWTRLKQSWKKTVFKEKNQPSGLFRFIFVFFFVFFSFFFKFHDLNSLKKLLFTFYAILKVFLNITIHIYL